MPQATYLLAQPGEDPQSVVNRLPRDCQQFWFHVNCTVTSRFPLGRRGLLAALTERDIEVFNGYVTDISKRHVQQFNREHGFPDVSAPESGDPDEMLIVKSNYNYAGGPDRRLSAEDLEKLGLNEAQKVPAGFEYLVGTRSSIDPSCWKNPALVCERFVSNPNGIWYRAWKRGPKIALGQLYMPAPIKKVRKSTRLQTTWLRTDDDSCSGLIPSLVSRFAAAFRLDYGAVDIVTDLQGTATVIDVNSTPWSTKFPDIVAYLTD